MDKHKTHSPKWFDGCFGTVEVPIDIRRLSERICQAYGIGGICDPLYIANIIALEMGLGDGQSTFKKD